MNRRVILTDPNRYRVIFTDRAGVEAGFRVDAASVDDAKDRARVAYATAYRRSLVEDGCTLTVEQE